MANTSKQAVGAPMPHNTALGLALRNNALLSGVTGLTLLVGAAGLDTWLGANPWVLAGIGAGLIFYAIDLVIWARSPKWLRRGGRLAIAADGLWVIGAVALIAFTDSLTFAGEAALGVVTVAVAALMVLQTFGLRRLEEVA